MRRRILSVLLGTALAILAVAPAAAQNNSRQVGLVNVSAGDVELLNGVNLAVAANVIATVCDLTVPVAVLANQIVVDGSETFCMTETGPITVEQSQPGDGGGTPEIGGNSSRQAGLVNVSLGDVEILNNVNIAAAVNAVITVCDATVPIAILAAQAVADVGETTCESNVGDILIQQAQ